VGTRLLLAGALLAVALVIAWRVERRRPAPPPRDVYPVPRQLDRADFPRPDAPWLVALFSSSSCASCAGVAAKVAVLDSRQVAACAVEFEESADLHRRYGISGIPTVVIADAEGVVRSAFVGFATATDLWAAVAEARNPGSSPEPELGAL
jgi:Thioredoxin